MLMHGWWACAGVTEVEAGWLLEVARPLVALSPPLDAPAPRYDPKQDAVVALHGATFGRHEWALPAAKRPHPDPRVRARAFAAALLGGEVFQELKGEGGGFPCQAGHVEASCNDWAGPAGRQSVSELRGVEEVTLPRQAGCMRRRPAKFGWRMQAWSWRTRLGRRPRRTARGSGAWGTS